MSCSLFVRSPRFRAFAFALPLVVASAASAETVDNINRTLEAQPGGKLVVDLQRGNIEVTTGSSSSVSIELERKVRASSKDKEEQYLADRPVTIEARDGRIYVREKKQSSTSTWSIFGRGTRVDAKCRIVVPAEFDLELDTSGGGIKVVGVTGEVEADTSGGSITIEDVTGKVEADTSGGSITFKNIRGDAKADTSGGSIKSEFGAGRLSADTSGGRIHVKEHSGDVDAETSGGGISIERVAGNVRAETSGGSIDAVLVDKPTGDNRFSTSGGSIAVTLPSDSAVNLDAATSGGSVRVDFEVAGVEFNKRRTDARGPINDGGPLLHLRTSGGSIHVKQSAESSASAKVER